MIKPWNLVLQAYSRFLFWKWDLEYHAADRRMRGCTHARTMFVDVGSPPFNCVEKCRDCWALRLPKLGGEWPTNELEWTPNMARPSRARQVSPPNASPLSDSGYHDCEACGDHTALRCKNGRVLCYDCMCKDPDARPNPEDH